MRFNKPQVYFEKERNEWRQETLKLRTALRRIMALSEKSPIENAKKIARESLEATWKEP